MLVARCWGETLNSILCFGFSGCSAGEVLGGGCVLYGELFLWLTVCSVSSPSVLFLAWPRSGPAQAEAEAPACTPATGGTAVVQHNIISVAEREGKAYVAVLPILPSVCAPQEFKFRAPVQPTSIFMIKTCKSCPPSSFYCQQMKRDRAKTCGREGTFVGFSPPQLDS